MCMFLGEIILHTEPRFIFIKYKGFIGFSIKILLTTKPIEFTEVLNFWLFFLNLRVGLMLFFCYSFPLGMQKAKVTSLEVTVEIMF